MARYNDNGDRIERAFKEFNDLEEAQAFADKVNGKVHEWAMNGYSYTVSFECVEQPNFNELYPERAIEM